MDKITEINCATGEVTERPLTDDEKQALLESQRIEEAEIADQNLIASLISKVEELESKLADLA
jgi:hypothetical protein